MAPLGPPGKRARKHRTSRKRSADTAACSLRSPARPARRPLRDRDVVSARPPRARRTSPSSSASSRVGSWAGAGAARYARTSRWTRSSRRSMRDGLTSRCCTTPTAARKVDSIGRRNTSRGGVAISITWSTRRSTGSRISSDHFLAHSCGLGVERRIAIQNDPTQALERAATLSLLGYSSLTLRCSVVRCARSLLGPRVQSTDARAACGDTWSRRTVAS
jgi:hypothetical protein